MAIPVYFAHETTRLKTLYEEITSAVNGDAATSALKGNPIYKSNFSFFLQISINHYAPIDDLFHP